MATQRPGVGGRVARRAMPRDRARRSGDMRLAHAHCHASGQAIAARPHARQCARPRQRPAVDRATHVSLAPRKRKRCARVAPTHTVDGQGGAFSARGGAPGRRSCAPGTAFCDDGGGVRGAISRGCLRNPKRRDGRFPDKTKGRSRTRPPTLPISLGISTSCRPPSPAGRPPQTSAGASGHRAVSLCPCERVLVLGAESGEKPISHLWHLY